MTLSLPGDPAAACLRHGDSDHLDYTLNHSAQDCEEAKAVLTA